MKITKNNQNGYGLILSILIGSILTIVTTTIALKVVNNSKQVIFSEKREVAYNIAEEGLEHTVDWLNDKNKDINQIPNISTLITTQDQNLVSKFNTPSTNTNIITTSVISNQLDLYGVKKAINPNTGSTIPNTFKISGKVEQKNSGEFEIEIRDANNSTIWYDYLEVRSTAYLPSKSDPNAIKRKIVSVIQRPKTNRVNLNHAIQSEGNIILGNGDTGSGTSATVLVAKEGHVHTNGNLSVGSQGKIDGDASAVGTITNSGIISGSINPGAPRQEVPQLKYDIPTIPCLPTVIDGKTVYGSTGDCIITGDLNGISGKNDIVIMNTVYVTGNYKQSGNATIESGSPLAKLIVKGELETSGNAATNPTTNRLIFSSDTSITLTGNSTMFGLFYMGSNNGDVTVTGNGNIFGAILSKGEVFFKGNNATVIRDLGLGNEEILIDPAGLKMRIANLREF